MKQADAIVPGPAALPGVMRAMSAGEIVARYNATGRATPGATRRNRVSELAVYSWTMPAHEKAVVNAALAVLENYMTKGGGAFADPEAVKQFLRLHLALEPHELFAVLFLDAKNRLIVFEVIFRGTISEAAVYPREVVQRCLAHGACAVVLSHNHPSGGVHPSRADEVLTQKLKAALALVDVQVLDHVIVGGDEAFSMAEQGML